jgi:hypothetical protein
VNGQTLNFHLAGINNQNFIMQDDETGTWWQQISGEAIQGPLRGERLINVYADELSFEVWKRENPAGRVLRPDPKVLAEDKYESADWEAEVARMPVRVTAKPDAALEPRTVIVGIEVNGESKAYPFSAILEQHPILDIVGGRHVVIFLGDDKKSVRAFDRTVDDRSLEFFVNLETSMIVDAESGSDWDFTGAAIAGELAGKQLEPIRTQKDYWFDWKTYHPSTQVYTLGRR